MSIDVNLFHPKLNTVCELPSGSIVAKLGDTEDGKAEVALFFMKNSDLSVRVLNMTPDSPATQVSQFITELLHQAGFTYYEYERSLCLDGCSDYSVTALHPSDPEPVATEPDEIVWVTAGKFVTIHQ